MRNLTRSLAALLLGALSVFAAGLPASAQGNSCDQQDDGYGASGVCSVTVLEAKPICPSGVLQMVYSLTAEGTSATTVDLHWLGTGGSDVVLAAQPLAGTVNWPAAVAQAPVDVRFVAGAQAVVSLNPTAALATCVTKTSSVLSVAETPARSSAVLASTGAEVLPYLAAGGALLVAGAALLVARAARQRRAVQ